MKLMGQARKPGATLATALYTYEESIEFTERIAKLLARKTGKAVYVGNSISFKGAGMGYVSSISFVFVFEGKEREMGGVGGDGDVSGPNGGGGGGG